MKAVAVTVTGRVQGVGFRWHATRQAQDLGVAGWVRNEPDGSVRAHLEGDGEAVDEMLEWLHHGPSGARVEGVVVDDAAVEDFAGFRVEL